jgi:hypothetical protein
MKVNLSLKPWGIIALAIVLAAGGYWLYAQWGADRSGQVAGGTPQIQVQPLSLDLGEVSVRGGTVTTLFDVKNVGDGELVIQDMETSCMCTEAALIVDGVEGPKLGMRGHGARPVWSARLTPGQEATLKVYYDPTVHAGLRGAVTRVVRLHTNDPKRPYVDVAIELIQVD